ncbi:hypothetical protein Nepgr_008483 [Nepenthes gracilis]|uniref:Stress enhanced protein 2 n=1 Tax=Nepenthes gracilis TaxID=150966 RepID=A0AAD3XJB1_NEPGR|nr:hypothetical protein Nepgr_008483 [Nepenthes gracilis]
MASSARAILCELQSQKPAIPPRVRPVDSSPEKVKIVLQPRLCTLRSYASDRGGVIRTRRNGDDGGDDLSPFLVNLYEYIESSKKSHDFEIISGRLAMLVFAATIGVEFVTGNSVFRKMDFQGIAEAAGVCLGAVTCAAIFAWFSSARSKVGRIFTLSCNSFIDSLIDNIVDGLFYESEFSDWSDEI